MRIQLVLEISRLDDSRYFHQHWIIGQPLVNKCGKRTKTLVIFVRVCSTRRVKTDRALSSLLVSYFFCWNKEKLRFRIQEAADEPTGRGAVDSNPFACDPLHSSFITLSSGLDMSPSQDKI